MAYVIRRCRKHFHRCAQNHKHLRICLKIREKTLIFQEATIANLLRDYITIKTHPSIKALKLERKILPKTE